MTQPRKPEMTPDEETLAFEAAVLRAVTDGTSETLTRLIRTILAAFEGTDTSTEEGALAFGKAVAELIRATRWEPMRPALGVAAIEAHRLGVRRALQRFRKPPPVKTPRRRAVSDVDSSLRSVLREAESLARQGIRTQTEAAVVAAKVSAGKARMEGAARYVANEGINAGTLDVARTMNLRVIWVPERNACLDCLAHAGYVVEPGGLFPGVSFDPKSRKVPAVPSCPLHPNCRCQLQTTTEPAGAPSKDRSAVSEAARLAAEARRSVVYQWTSYESSPAMARAADALLSAGAGLPASVETRARRMLRARGGKR